MIYSANKVATLFINKAAQYPTLLLILMSMSFLLSRRQLSTFAVTRLGRSYQKPSTSYFSTINANTGDDDGLVLSQVDEDSGVAILAMNRPPANSLNLQMYVATIWCAYACLYIMHTFMICTYIIAMQCLLCQYSI